LNPFIFVEAIYATASLYLLKKPPISSSVSLLQQDNRLLKLLQYFRSFDVTGVSEYLGLYTPILSK